MVYSNPKENENKRLNNETQEQAAKRLFGDRPKGTKKPLNQGQLDFIFELYQKGISSKKISEICLNKVSSTTIGKRIKEGVWHTTRTGGSISQNTLNQMKEDYEKMSREELAKKYEVSLASITRFVQNNWERKKRKNKYTFNENFFDVIDSEEKAYWLGFFYADGYILSKRKREGKNESQSFGMALSISDIEIIERFKKDIQAENPINIYDNKGTFNGGKAARILLTSQHTVDQLKEKGVLEQKTFILTFPDETIVPKSLLHHFIRGYFDGDGSISVYKEKEKFNMSFEGTKEFLGGIQSFFGTNVKISQRWPERNNNSYSLKYCGNRQIERLCSILYKDATVFLKRKFEVFQALVEKNISTDINNTHNKNTVKTGV